MISKPRKTIRELFEEGTPVDRALDRGVREVLRRHKLLGQSIVVWREGRPVEVPPDEIVVPPAADASDLD